MWELFRFAAWTAVLVLAADFIYSAFHQGRHLNDALRWRPRKRNR